jgi:hypothetical protein
LFLLPVRYSLYLSAVRELLAAAPVYNFANYKVLPLAEMSDPEYDFQIRSVLSAL